MIKKLICWLWGHKVVVKACTGDTYQTRSYLGNVLDVSFYKWVRNPFCLRCGKPTPPGDKES